VTEAESVFDAALRAAAEGRAVALATIVGCRGSTQQGVGSRMLVDPERGLVGTVGGGCGEGQVVEAAREVLHSGVPRLLRIDLTEDLFSWSPAVCGGVFDVFVEPVRPRDAPAAGRS
jgi:xanthine/CO dehydrogenase XdhC/CoxF family maturation factor